MNFDVSDTWKATYPGASVGILLIREVANPASHAALDEGKAELEGRLRSRFAAGGRAAVKALATCRAYSDYYRRYKKTYHVQQQLESIALKGQSIPRVAALVEAMFMAELENQLLTAGHDWELVESPVRIDVATGDERYVRLNGREQQLKAGDMMITDAEGVISCVLYGPDFRTRITSATRHALFTVYAPPGIAPEAVEEHLHDIQRNVSLIAPGAKLEFAKVQRA